jgi:hypothetical protein
MSNLNFISLKLITIGITASIVTSMMGSSLAAENGYAQEMFRRAMSKDNPSVSGSVSLSPLYVLITVTEPESGVKRKVCLWSTRLRAAIHAEYHLGNSYAADRREFAIAIRSGRRFRFVTAKGRENIAPLYSDQILKEVRSSLSGKTESQLRADVEDWQSSLTQLYSRENWMSDAYRDAVAHVLLEHGILVGCAHEEKLYLEEIPH